MRIGAIEAGGTKIVCGIGNENGEIEDRFSFPTERPERTLDQVMSVRKPSLQISKNTLYPLA